MHRIKDSTNHTDKRFESVMLDLNSSDPIKKSIAIESLKEFGTRSIKVLFKLFEDPNEDVRWAASRVLSKIEGDEKFDLLITGLRHENPEIRIMSAHTIRMNRHCGMMRTKDDLIRLLNDPEIKVRYAATGALGSLNCSDIIPHLSKLLEDQDPHLRHLAVRGLGELRKTRATDALIKASTDSYRYVRLGAVEALGRNSYSPCLWVFSIKYYIKYPKTCVRRIHWDISDIFRKRKAVRALIASLDDQDPEVRRHAIIALGELRDRKAVRFLVPLLKTSKGIPLRTVCQALARLGYTPPIGSILKTLEKNWPILPPEKICSLDSMDSLNELNRLSEDRLTWTIHATGALGRLKNKTAWDTLISVLNYDYIIDLDHVPIYNSSETELEKRKVKGAIDEINRKTSSVRWSVSDTIIEKFHNKRAVEALVSVLNDKAVRGRALNNLEIMEIKGTGELLKNKLNEIDEEFKPEVIKVIEFFEQGE